MDWDEGGVFVNDSAVGPNDERPDKLFDRFLRNFREKNIFVYREQLKRNCRLGNYFLIVTLEDLESFGHLATKLKSDPTRYLEEFTKVVNEYARNEHLIPEGDNNIQIVLDDEQNPMPIRNLMNTHLTKIVSISGIIIGASKKQAKATQLVLQCRNCQITKRVEVKQGYAAVQLPKACDGMSNMGSKKKSDEKCPPDPFVILPDQCSYVDHQSLKLQEAPETVPTGEIPRHIRLSVERALVGKVIPGMRVKVLGIFSVMGGSQMKSGVQQSYVKVLGMRQENSGRYHSRFTPEEEEDFLKMSRDKDIYDRIVKSIAPAVYGHDEIKKALACQLFGGSRIILPDGVRLRGDINVLLLGDPGTAKSQMLKFIEKLAPIGVYTSGKGSSAAGLTASVVKDKSSREFYLEGGAMVLADGGIVCIDEFDKMKVQDRVAIHEAMEQQTISIAKAGITTILNSRTAVLAAANPVFGRYDEMKSAGENIDFQATILSRFDLIFLIKDHLSEQTDRKIASHVLDLHTKTQTQTQEAEIPLAKLKSYIAYCRSKISPRLSPEASELLKNHYVNIRLAVRNQSKDPQKGGKTTTIPITVRQLEAVIRIAESLAKISLSPTATEAHVNEAIRLFKVSTYEAATTGIAVSETVNPHLMTEIQSAEQLLKRRLPIGSQISEKNVIDDFVKQGISETAVRKALVAMVQRDELEYRAQRKRIYRKC